jgi:hypothetical protein
VFGGSRANAEPRDAAFAFLAASLAPDSVSGHHPVGVIAADPAPAQASSRRGSERSASPRPGAARTGLPGEGHHGSFGKPKDLRAARHRRESTLTITQAVPGNGEVVARRRGCLTPGRCDSYSMAALQMTPIAFR